MITLRRANERGHANHGWLDSWHSFSFANYFDPEHVQWGALRVINEDRVRAGAGFGQHGHRDMEIISYVLDGALAHEDSLGNRASIVPGEVQRMSAGTGVVHAEFNHDKANTTHFLQIWIVPSVTGVAPSYEQKSFADSDKRGRLRVVVSPDGRDGSVTIHQDALMLAGLFDGDEHARHEFAAGRLGYVHVVRGQVTVNGQALVAGDALRLQDETAITLDQGRDAEVLVFDLPPMPLH
ncbi:pirin family protein [Agrilutibacter solisilvae]|uniref:Pirin family protein n=1 Tax=Agrilutibacter solisilvae TaxID=2763317 RepID=A0A974Y5A7_9GAMM|nr:pirin family protein [Lysobacter solisilvae]QSX78571.1 pirin family protein [Lysobacter solisilvae]